MSDLSDRLLRAADDLDGTVKESTSKKFTEPLARLREAANEVGRAWSRSFLGYHARVYYADLDPVPPGAHWSMQWGPEQILSEGTRGDWREYTFEGVRDEIFSRAEVASLNQHERTAERAKEAFEHARNEFFSVIATATRDDDPFLSRLRSEVEKMKIRSRHDFARAMHPSGRLITYDQRAISDGGFHTPPHLAVLAEVVALQNATEQCAELAKILRRAASHLQGQKFGGREKTAGTNICLGHGRSTLWKELRDFLKDRLGLPWDEFNRVPVAGITNIARLSEMLDHAAIAFLVMTAEDEQRDGTLRARENVIHEAGLFQGRLGFTKAIVLLEEGCEEFSNIHGLGQIRFPRSNIKAAFEEIRLVLEREGLLE